MTNPLSLASINPPVRQVINLLTRLHILRDWYDEWLGLLPGKTADARAFLNFVMEKLEANVLVSNPQLLSKIPAHGALLIVANHPLGAIEGMLLSRLLLGYRPDLKVLTNELLLRFPEFSELFIGVDVLSSNAGAKNLRGMRSANRHLAGGGALLIFPAGTVAGLNLLNGKVEDRPWSTIIGRLALRYKASCLPFHIDSRNSVLFYLAGCIHKRLRTALLPRAMLEKRNTHLRVVAGPVIRHDDLAELGSPSSVTQYLRVCCDLLGANNPVNPGSPQLLTMPGMVLLDPASLARQLDELGEFQVATAGNYSVYCAPYNKLGCLADLLAANREIAFRMAGEGTGKTVDRDRFDEHYWHVVAWDHDRQRLIGGYRVIRADQATKKLGLKGLYSNSLFHYGHSFLKAIGPAIEVGRSFITGPYQRNPRALDLLWKGIGAFVRNNSDCHTLFGCVSISARYSPLARTLLTDTLLHNHSVGESTRKLVRPVIRKPGGNRTWNRELLEAFANVAIFNKLLGTMGANQRLPTMIRHYVAMNGRFAEFTVNQGFNKSLDGLIIVDLRHAPLKYLRRYLGEDISQDMLNQWSTY